MAKRMLRDWTDSEKVDLLDAYSERFFTRLIMKVDDHGCFHANPKLLKSSLFPLKENLSSDDIILWMEKCEEVGLIQIYSANNKNYLRINEFGQRLRTMKSNFPQPDDNSRTIVSNCLPEVEDEDEVEYEEEIEQIVNFLNSVLESSFKSKSKNTSKHIIARLREKFTVDDFKKVIQSKFLDWSGDEKMKNYLRPETLFGTKFESYLQTSNLKNNAKQGDYNSNKASVASIGDEARRILSDTSSFQLKTGN